MPKTAVEQYLDFLVEFRRLSPGRLNKNRKWLARIEIALGFPIIEAKAGSQINQAILEVAKNRKTANNGGAQDDGANLKFCLAQAVVCFIRWAVAEGVIARNLYPMNPFPEPAEHPPNHLTDQDKLKKIFKADVSLRDRLAISILLDTGMRIGELCAIKVSDYDKEGKFFRVYMTKVDRPKTPVVSEQTDRLISLYLRTRAGRSEWLFPGRMGKHITTNAIRKNFFELGNRLGFRMNPHSFRHTQMTTWLHHGAQESEIMEQAGLKDRKTLKRYLHPSVDHMHKVQEKVYSGARVYA